MKEISFEEGLTLFLINRIKDYESSYYLLRALNSMFGIFYGNEILRTLLSKNLVTKDVRQQLSFYYLTQVGESLLRINKNEIIKIIREDYLAKKPEYVEALLKD